MNLDHVLNELSDSDLNALAASAGFSKLISTDIIPRSVWTKLLAEWLSRTEGMRIANMPPNSTQTAEELAEKFLALVAQRKGVELPEASKYIDECIKHASASLNMEYSKIYTILFSAESLKECMKTDPSCSELDIEQCIESCKCVVFNNKCISRRINNADVINEDPDTFVMNTLEIPDLKYLHKASAQSIKKLQNLVEKAAYLYYNYDGGGLDDNAFDALEYYLKKATHIKGRLYEKIGAPPVEKIRTELPYNMPSLAKAKPGEATLTSFLDTRLGTTQCVWSIKLDGISGMVVYNSSGQLDKIYTHGNGVIGGDVTYLKDYVKNIPLKINATDQIVVRGEFILSKKNWDDKYKGSYANARSFVSGKVNAGFISPSLHDIEFVAYELMRYSPTTKKTLPLHSKSLRILVDLGFNTVSHGVLSNPTTFELIDLYKTQRIAAEYHIDGLVLTVDTERPQTPSAADTVSIPTHSIAFKMALEEQIRSTKVQDVEWNISRYGRYVPVVVYQPVYINGFRLHRATGHNAKHIQDWNMGKDTKIKVIRSGDTIPQIKDVDIDFGIDPIYPATSEVDGGYDWHWDRSDIVLDEIEGNKEVMIKRMEHFFQTVGIRGVGPAISQYMYDSGLKTPELIISASIKQLMTVKRVGATKANAIYNDIRNAMSSVPPDRFIVATSVFNSNIGRKLLKTLFRYIPGILNMDESQIRRHFAANKVPGFGPARIPSVAAEIPKFREYLNSFATHDIDKIISYYVRKTENITARNKKIEGKKFVLTGFMGNIDYELEDYIYDNMGDFAETVNKGVEAVITGNVTEVSKKILAAQQLKIPVLTIKEFSTRYNVPLKRFQQKEDGGEDGGDDTTF